MSPEVMLLHSLELVPEGPSINGSKASEREQSGKGLTRQAKFDTLNWLAQVESDDESERMRRGKPVLSS